MSFCCLFVYYVHDNTSSKCFWRRNTKGFCSGVWRSGTPATTASGQATNQYCLCTRLAGITRIWVATAGT